jgi:UDP-glucose 4-epimerase
MQIVITGASGFLGSVLLKCLKKNGYNCLGVSRKPGEGYLQVYDYSDSPIGDILIHLAEISDRGLANELSATYELDASRTLNSLLSKGYSKIIYVSSAALYGDNISEPRTENDLIIVSDTYTRVKMNAEQKVLSQNGIVIRLSNIYGPSMSRNNVFSRILEQLNGPGPLTVMNTNPVRDFLWIDDAVNAMLKMVIQSLSGVFNIGSGIGTSIRSLTQEMLIASNQENREVLSIQRNQRESCIVLDITKSSIELDWSPCVSLKEGVARLISLQKNSY